MRALLVLLVAFGALSHTPAPCHAADTPEAAGVLRKAYARFDWQSSTTVALDINADGTVDLAMLGYTAETAAVGIVLGGDQPYQTQILEFARGRADLQRGMCGKSAVLLVEKQSEAAKEALEAFPQGYRICENCYEIAIDDDTCDPIHIYWNHETDELDWWRA